MTTQEMRKRVQELWRENLFMATESPIDFAVLVATAEVERERERILEDCRCNRWYDEVKDTEEHLVNFTDIKRIINGGEG